MIQTTQTQAALQEVVNLLESKFRVRSYGFEQLRVQLDVEMFGKEFDWDEVHQTDERPFVNVRVPDSDLDLDDARAAVAQVLLDAGYRCFWSSVSVECFHPQRPEMEAVMSEPSEIKISFLGDNIKRYTPEQIQSQLETRERAKERRSLNGALKRRGLL